MSVCLVNEESRLTLLDPKATSQVVKLIRDSEREKGIKLRAKREMQDGDMQTTCVEEISD